MKLRYLLVLLAALSVFAASCGSDEPVVAVEPAEEAAPEVGTEAMQEEAMEEDAAAEPAEEAMEEDVAEEAAEEAMEEEPAVGEDEAMEGEAVDQPSRIVSLNPTGTEMLFAIGAGDQVIAVDNFSYYPPEAPVVDDLAAFGASVEAIATFEPDLVITAGPVEGLGALGVEVVQLDAAASLDDTFSQIETLGAATGNIAGAAELVLQMQTDIDAVLASIPERETPLTYYHELDNTLYSVTSSTFIGYVYGLFGMENAADAADPDGESFGYPQLNSEYLLTTDPDIIFLADTICCGQSAATVSERPGWEQLSAVQSGNIVELNDDVASRWGPRLVEFIEVVGEAVANFETASAS